MGCLPDSGGCERRHTDAFITILDDVDSKDYKYIACLDQIYRNTPQPEALYRDQRTKDELVIERKTIFWPEDYVVRHKNDHHLMDLIVSSTKDLFLDAAYELTLPHLFSVSQKELKAFSRSVVNDIRKNISNVEKMKFIQGIEFGYKWSCRKLRSCEKEGFSWTNGLVVDWNVSRIDPNIGDSSYAIHKLKPQLMKIFRSCDIKFAGYSNARRILLLDQQGDLEFMGTKWWLDIFSELNPSPSIIEIWLGLYVTVTEEGEWGWIFRKLYPNTGNSIEDYDGVLLDEFTR